jgi:phosphoribosylamine---glycine ligase
MNVLLIGSGGREHAIAWKLAQSPKLSKLYIAPGNPGTAALGENLAVEAEDHAAVVACCREKQIELVVVGPEIPLAAGLADDLLAAEIKVFGPSKAAAQIEASKAFAKAFMARQAIPSARFATFDRLSDALVYLERLDHPVVLKASGLAAGKGVLLPETRAEAKTALESILVGGAFGDAGSQVVIEERLGGPEVSLLAFSDGKTVKPMIPSQDHKRIFDGDRGPNTGGMGAYAPVPICPQKMVDDLLRIALQPAVDGLREEGHPFVGVLYGGFMLTPDGPRVIEFNCRFGDPETQVVLPLLDSDLLEIALACCEGRLDRMDIVWKEMSAACVVLASGGYPDRYVSGLPVDGLEQKASDAIVFHAGTKQVDDRIVTSGGRVVCVTGLGKDIRSALDAAYERVASIHFEGMQFRRDIAWRAVGAK